ncbi:MAG: tripartite tricarboxylate transporter TctB family protein [Candidatus Limnocylindria bacterium]
MTTDRVAGVALAIFSLYVLWESRRLPLGSLQNPGPAYMPVVLALFLAAAAAVIALQGGAARRLRGVGWVEWRHALAIFAVCVFAALALERLGYRLTVGLAIVFLVGVVERKPPVLTLAFAVALAASTYFLFDTLLRVQLPRGPFGL